MEKGNVTVYLASFRLERATAAAFLFRVDDGGIGDGCFLLKGNETRWKEGGGVPGDLGCKHGQEEAQVETELPPGEYVLALRARECPMKDCRMRFATRGVPAGDIFVGSGRYGEPR